VTCSRRYADVRVGRDACGFAAEPVGFILSARAVAECVEAMRSHLLLVPSLRSAGFALFWKIRFVAEYRLQTRNLIYQTPGSTEGSRLPAATLALHVPYLFSPSAADTIQRLRSSLHLFHGRMRISPGH
jgi:hypothetical protein